MSFAVILAAAGKSTRFGHPSARKPFVTLGMRAVWQHSHHAFSAVRDISQMIVVVSAEDYDWFCTTNNPDALEIDVVTGGSTRADSVGRGIAAVRDAELIAVHDAARPLVTTDSIERVFAAARDSGAAILATPVTSTVKSVADGSITQTVPRDCLWLAQTPQVARREWFERAYADRNGPAWQPSEPTDEAQLLERCGYPVAVVDSPPTNFKITTQDDLVIARALVASADSPTSAVERPK